MCATKVWSFELESVAQKKAWSLELEMRRLLGVQRRFVEKHDVFKQFLTQMMGAFVLGGRHLNNFDLFPRSFPFKTLKNIGKFEFLTTRVLFVVELSTRKHMKITIFPKTSCFTYQILLHVCMN